VLEGGKQYAFATKQQELKQCAARVQAEAKSPSAEMEERNMFSTTVL
jgi:hypothetical protein